MNSLLIRTGGILLAIAAVAAIAGLIFGAATGWALFSLALLGFLVHHLRHIDALTAWLARPQPGQVPEGYGAWDEIFALLYRFERAAARQQRQLTDAVGRWRQAGQALPDGVVILNDQNRIEWCNETAESHFGLNARGDVGQPITNLVRHPNFVAYASAGDFAKPAQIRAGNSGRALLSVQLIPYGDDRKLLFSRDMTQLETLETTRRDFVANVSHELRTPLTVLSGFLETVQELKLDPQRTRDYLHLMEEQTRRMQRLVDDLLMLSAIESAPEPSRAEHVGVSRLLAKLKTDAEALSGGRHRITLDGVEGYDLTGSEGEISSAFGNLVSNAIRYTPAGGEVRLIWQASPEGARFTVEDTGIGIETHQIPRLTERFYRVDRGRSRETGGTGLGLAIVKHALLRHQAILEIHSEPGRGSRFTALFPARRVVPATPRPHSATAT
ncbi:MAG: phosphate regulon sensor histidine kinase PhoR [Betaproteobacteria bacterium]